MTTNKTESFDLGQNQEQHDSKQYWILTTESNHIYTRISVVTGIVIVLFGVSVVVLQ